MLLRSDNNEPVSTVLYVANILALQSHLTLTTFSSHLMTPLTPPLRPFSLNLLKDTSLKSPICFCHLCSAICFTSSHYSLSLHPSLAAALAIQIGLQLNLTKTLVQILCIYRSFRSCFDKLLRVDTKFNDLALCQSRFQVRQDILF